MAKTNDREIVIEDKLLMSLVEDKGELVEAGRVLSKEIEEAMNRVNKLTDQSNGLAAKITNKKRDIFKRLEKLVKKDIGEFEIPITTEIRNGKLVLIVTDALSEFKQSFGNFDKFKEAVPRKQK